MQMQEAVGKTKAPDKTWEVKWKAERMKFPPRIPTYLSWLLFHCSGTPERCNPEKEKLPLCVGNGARPTRGS